VRAALLCVVMAFLIPYLKAQGQSNPASATAQSSLPLNLPTSHAWHKPNISLRAALKIAESHVIAEHIDVSDGWLTEARFILYGDRAKADKDKDPCWLFVWTTSSSHMRVHVDVIVSMDGKAMTLPSI
jgi:hypothetical protein